MPETSIVCARVDAPPIGSTYEFTLGQQQLVGTVVAHRATPRVKSHVAVVVEITEADHRRMILGD